MNPNPQHVERIRAAQGKLTSAMNTLAELDGEEIDMEGMFASDAESIREVVEALAKVIKKSEESKDGEEDEDEDEEEDDGADEDWDDE